VKPVLPDLQSEVRLSRSQRRRPGRTGTESVPQCYSYESAFVSGCSKRKGLSIRISPHFEPFSIVLTISTRIEWLIDRVPSAIIQSKGWEIYFIGRVSR